MVGNDGVIEHGEHEDLVTWLAPFLSALRVEPQRRWAELYARGLIGGEGRKTISAVAQRFAQGRTSQLHHFLTDSPWDEAPLEAALARVVGESMGGDESVLIVDDTPLPKKGRHSVGVARQWCGVRGKVDNCQSLVSLTLARDEVPMCVGLRLFLPKAWAEDGARRRRARVPEALGFRTRPEIALDEIDRLVAHGVEFALVSADAGYGADSAFRSGLSERKLTWAVGIGSKQHVYACNVELHAASRPATGRRAKHPTPSVASQCASDFIDAHGRLRAMTWRRGTKGALRGRFAAVRVRVADAAKVSHGRRLPGDEAWLVCEQRSSGERKYYLSNLPPNATRLQLVRAIKVRWSCEQAHQQMKQELGLGDFEGRSWVGLHRHCLLTMIAFAYLQHRRLAAKKGLHQPRSEAD